MGINYLDTPPADWDTATTLWVAALNELYVEMVNRKRRRRRGGMPSGLSPSEEHKWRIAAGREYILLDENGERQTNSKGDPIRFTAGDKEYEVDPAAFQRYVDAFYKGESDEQYDQRLAALLAATAPVGGADGRPAH